MMEIDGKNIFRIKVQPCFSSKTWVNFLGYQDFFIRNENETIPLSGEDADDYWVERLQMRM